MRLSKTMRATAVAATGALVLSGCLASNDKTSGDAGANDNTGKTLTFTVAFSGAQYDAFKAAVDPYAKSQGITIKWASDSNFNANIVNKVKAGNIPDIAMFPQPGILLNFAKQGKVADLGKVLDIPKLKSEMVSGITDPGTLDGKVYGVAPSINVKSLVFYPKKAWAKAGLTPPTTLDQLTALAAKIKASGKTPWCMGIESGTASGWPATDWIENLVLNYGGTDQYNQWVQHKIKFDSPLVRKAAAYFQNMFASNGYVNGGRKAIAATNFGTAGNAMFAPNNTSAKPGCYMYKQGNFITQSGFFPAAILKDVDTNVGAFFFPGQTADSKPVEGGGDLAALFSGKNESAKKIMKFILTKDFCASCAKLGGYISPFKDFDPSNYPNDLTRQMANIAYKATDFAFDGSDAMPGEVGSGSFWKQMVSWVNGDTSLDSALKAIDESWPTS